MRKKKGWVPHFVVSSKSDKLCIPPNTIVVCLALVVVSERGGQDDGARGAAGLAPHAL